MHFTAHNESDTERFAQQLAAKLTHGAVVALEGPMGAGKTRLTRALVKALGGNPRQVSSPTFVLLNIYETPALKIHHLDAYRVTSEGDLEGIGFLELLEQPGAITLVEWPSKVPGLLPAHTIRVTITPDDEEPTVRRFEVSGLSV